MIKIAINGFGRIGRPTFKIALDTPGLEVVAINDLTDTRTLAHLLKYDTVYGIYEREVNFSEDYLIVDHKEYRVYAEKDPEKLPWRKLDVDIVLECTGFFTEKEGAEKHIEAGAKRVIISAPTKSEGLETHVLGVSEVDGKQEIISNASCTTNCITPVIQVLHSKFGVEKSLMTTIHAYTSTQNLVDGPSKDLRRARAAGENLVPTSTGAALATTKVIPDLAGKFDGLAIRVPVICGSLADITAVLKKKVTVDEVNKALKEAKDNPIYKDVLDVTEEPLVSSDIIKNPLSAIVDLELTRVIGDNLVKVVGWYDNEWGYAYQFVRQTVELGEKL